MPLGEKERQDREVFQRNMRSRMETFKSTRYKRHKKERSFKKARHINSTRSFFDSVSVVKSDTAAQRMLNQHHRVFLCGC